MNRSTITHEQIKNRKYVTWLFFCVILSLVLSGQINYWMPEHSHMDFNKYIAMAEKSPSLNTEVIQPYVHRIFAPWFAGLLPLKLEISFYLLNVLSLFLMIFSFYHLLKLNGLGFRIAFVLTFVLVFNRYFFQFLAWDYFHLSDSLSFALLFISLILFIKHKWTMLMVISVLCVLTREVSLLIIPTGYAYLYQTKSNSKEYRSFTIAVLPAALIFILVRILIMPAGGDNLLTKFLEEGGAYFFTAESLIKKFIIPLAPFSLLPFIFYKELKEFSKRYFYLVVLFLAVIFTTLFGLDYERLMTPSAPVYFIFVGFIIQNYLNEKENKDVLRKFLVVLMIGSFMLSFYHLWGIIRYTSSFYSLMATFIITLLITIHFAALKFSTLRLLPFWSKKMLS